MPVAEVAETVRRPLPGTGVIVKGLTVFADNTYVRAAEATIAKYHIARRRSIGHSPPFVLQGTLQSVALHLIDLGDTGLTQY